MLQYPSSTTLVFYCHFFDLAGYPYRSLEARDILNRIAARRSVDLRFVDTGGPESNYSQLIILTVLSLPHRKFRIEKLRQLGADSPSLSLRTILNREILSYEDLATSNPVLNSPKLEHSLKLEHPTTKFPAPPSSSSQTMTKGMTVPKRTSARESRVKARAGIARARAVVDAEGRRRRGRAKVAKVAVLRRFRLIQSPRQC